MLFLFTFEKRKFSFRYKNLWLFSLSGFWVGEFKKKTRALFYNLLQDSNLTFKNIFRSHIILLISLLYFQKLNRVFLNPQANQFAIVLILRSSSPTYLQSAEENHNLVDTKVTLRVELETTEARRILFVMTLQLHSFGLWFGVINGFDDGKFD